MQAGAITGFVSAFAEGPIDFFKSQIQVQIIRSKSDPNYKRATSPSAFCETFCATYPLTATFTVAIYRSAAIIPLHGMEI